MNVRVDTNIDLMDDRTFDWMRYTRYSLFPSHPELWLISKPIWGVVKLFSIAMFALTQAMIVAK